MKTVFRCFIFSFIFVIESYSVFCNDLRVICTNDALQNTSGKNLRIRVYLEGSIMNAGNTFSTDGRKLMRDNLRVSPFNGKNYIPLTDPYQSIISTVDLSVVNKHVGIGSSPSLCTIADSSAVFGVTGQNAIVDWVFVEIRSALDHKEVIATRSGLLQRDSDVVDVDGVSELNFPDLTVDTFYVVVRHRNHLGVMSALVNSSQLIDFTKPTTPVFDFGTSLNPNLNYGGEARKYINSTISALWAGDFNADCRVKHDSPSDDQNILFYDVFMYPTNLNNATNFQNALGYFQGDYDMNSKSKYENPSDDRNMLFSQIIFYFPNNMLLSNFSHFIEQVPRRN
ncbi:MAG TPA: hypothetical protein PKD51_11655 [Saprospiraceae bacterium]|nr:hypothetical protein [Saprospiraceae bacterium]HMU02093.1 hypothetical protein [Saprospiraceae bacterium]